MDYEASQQKLLRRTKKSIYRVLAAHDVITTQTELSKAARRFGYDYLTSSAVQHRSMEIVSKLYDPVPIPMASSLTDLYNQNNLICCCLTVLTSTGRNNESYTPPIFISLATDPTYRTEIQHLVFSRLLEQLERVTHSTQTPRNDYESLYNLIQRLTERLERIEHRLEVEDSDHETNG